MKSVFKNNLRIIVLLSLLSCVSVIASCILPNKQVDFPFYETQKDTIIDALQQHLIDIEHFDNGSEAFNTYRHDITLGVASIVTYIQAHEDFTFYESKRRDCVMYVVMGMHGCIFVDNKIDWKDNLFSASALCHEISHLAIGTIDLEDEENLEDVPLNVLPFQAGWYELIVRNYRHPHVVWNMLNKKAK